MSDTSPPEAFELFPRRELRIRHTRRQFLALLALEMQVAEGRATAGAAYKLSKLGTLADEQLAQIRPQVVPGTLITVRGGVVHGRPYDCDEVRPLFADHPVTVAVFERMDGRQTLAQIGHDVAALTGWPPATAFAYARGLFLHLVEQCVGAPH